MPLVFCSCFEREYKMINDSSRSSKVVVFCTDRKRVCDFLLILNRNLGPILPRFRVFVRHTPLFSIPQPSIPAKISGGPLGVTP